MKPRSLSKRLLESVAFLLALLLLGSFGYATYVEFPTAHAEDPVTGVIGFLSEPSDGEPLELALAYLRENRAALGLTEEDLADVVVKDQYRSQHNGVTHIYLRQRLNGLELFNADLNINISRDGRVINLNNDFVPNLAQSLGGSRQASLDANATISASEAVAYAADELNLTISEPLEDRRRRGSEAGELLLSDGGISQQDIPVKQIYQLFPPGEKGGGGTVGLAWDLEIYETDGENYWSVRVDAANGQLLDIANWVIHDDWGQTLNRSNDFSSSPSKTTEVVTTMQPCSEPEQYNVYAMPLESPNHGERSLVTHPADPIASPFGWHDWDGLPGAEFPITRGNNVDAYEGGNHHGYRPDGGPDLCFNFDLDLTQPPDAYEGAAISNLFYWSNIIHDLFYQYGFDEASGNFQQYNDDELGGVGGDYLLAEAQDGGGFNNANFLTRPDGQNPRMQMYLWNLTMPQRDGALDSGIIVHEYGHGISMRLTGGPSNASCLQNAEQGGEGWSDWFALALTAEAGDLASDPRGIAAYVLNQSPTGPGIRPAPYSTDMSVNGYTYRDIGGLRVPHEVGFVWGTMLWEMYWNLVEVYGFDPELYHGTGGNNIALQLVIDGLKLQPCHPGFVNARDAILFADQVTNEGANQCLLWRAFAKRGLGVSAHQGDRNSTQDGHEAFDLPPSCTSAEISLLPGWNLVSIPLQLPPASEISQLLRPIAGNYERVYAYAYDECEEDPSWKLYDPNSLSFANSLTKVDETMGLWIKMTVTDTLVVTGTLASETTIRSCSGWNLVGYPSLNEQPVAEVLHSIEGKYSIVNAYLPDIWHQFAPNAPPFANTLDNMSPGKGYWLKSNEEVEWTISPLPPASPAMQSPMRSPMAINGQSMGARRVVGK